MPMTMPTDTPLGEFTARMRLALRQSGAIAVALRGLVTNEGKTVAQGSGGPLLQARRSALTVVDLLIQDVLLMAVLDSDLGGFILDAEEDTAFSARHVAPAGCTTTLVIDPIDGTFDYLNGGDGYSICLGLSVSGVFVFSAVYFPCADTLYLSDRQGAFKGERFSVAGPNPLAKIARVEPRGKVVCVSSRVPAELIAQLESSGYTVRNDEHACPASGALLGCLNGEVLCYIGHTKQIRDVLLGALIQNLPFGYGVDWAGRELQWPDGGRVPHTIFGIGACPPDIVQLTRLFA
jgi:fructose-1,6-bisphosphatase/inositol monophosphatase family enzyme